jgi:hypothetical protein
MGFFSNSPTWETMYRKMALQWVDKLHEASQAQGDLAMARGAIYTLVAAQRSGNEKLLKLAETLARRAIGDKHFEDAATKTVGPDGKIHSLRTSIYGDIK